MFDWLYDRPFLAYALSAIAVLIAGEAGRFFGIRWRSRNPDAASSEIVALEGAMLGLLALMIGFTFAMTLSRFDARQKGVVDEANSISTTALWARLLPDPQATEAQNLLRNYVDIRLKLIQNGYSPTALATAVRDSDRLHVNLWQGAVQLGRTATPTLITAIYAQNLTRMFDMQAVRIAAGRNRVPPVVFILLLGIAMAALGLSGYAAGLNGRGGRIPHAIMAIVVASVIAMVADIDSAQTGYITIDQQVLTELKTNLWPTTAGSLLAHPAE